MTAPTNWPNPERPGVPLFPERDGWHIVDNELLFWASAQQMWATNSFVKPTRTSENVGRSREYYGVVLTPTRITEMLAEERDRAAKEAQRVSDKYYEQREKEPLGFARENCIQNRLSAAEWAKAIRNLGATP